MDKEIIDDTKKEISQLINQGRIQDAIPMIRQAAHWGDLESQQLLIDMFLNGAYDIRKDPKDAFQYVRLAALNGDPLAMAELARMSHEGLGTDKDDARAFHFMKKAADANLKEAYDGLASYYLMGIGTLRNLDKAKIWIAKAKEAFPEDANILKHERMLEKLLEKNR